MKILQVGKFYHPTPGGIETVLRNLSEGLVEAGDEVTVLCSAEGRASFEEEIRGVRVLRAARFGTALSQPISPGMIVSLLSEHRKFDIVQFHTPNPLMEGAAFLLSNRVPAVVTYHSDVVRQKFVWPAYRHFQWEFLNRVDRIVVPSRRNIASSAILPDLAERCEEIPYGIETSHLKRTPQVGVRAEQLRSEHGRFVLFVGRLVGYKGVEVLIDAFGRMGAKAGADVKAVIVGGGPLEEELKQRVAVAGLGDRVRFAGRVPDEEMPAYFHACEAFVLPSISRAEAFGIVLLEAMACGKPLITSDLPTAVSVVNEKDVTGLHVPVGDADALAAAIVRLMSDDALRAMMGDAAHRRCEEVYSRKAMVDAYRALFQRLREKPEPRVARSALGSAAPDPQDPYEEPTVQAARTNG